MIWMEWLISLLVKLIEFYNHTHPLFLLYLLVSDFGIGLMSDDNFFQHTPGQWVLNIQLLSLCCKFYAFNFEVISCTFPVLIKTFSSCYYQ